MNMSDCRTQDGRDGADMTRGRAGQREGCMMLKLWLFLRLAWRWGVFALPLILVIGVSESRRTFASLVTNPYEREVVLLRTLRRPGTIRPAQVVSNSAFYERELLRSIELGEMTYAESLVAAGVSVNTTDPQGWTAVMLAARHNRIAFVTVLCERGADVNAHNEHGTTVLMLAANNGYREMVHLLLDRGALVNAKTSSGWTALMYASWKGYAAIAAGLLQAGADPTVVDSQRWTAFMYAAWQGHAETVQVLLESQKTKAMSEREKKQARMLATSQGHIAIVHLLDQAERHG